MTKEIINEELAKEAVALHMQIFVHRITDALKDFIKPLDPSEGAEEMAYIRSVIESIDNVVATALMVKDDEMAMAQMKASTDAMIQNLIELHNGKETKH